MANLTFKIKMKTSGTDVVAGDLVNNEIVFGANPSDKNLYIKDNTAELHTFMPVDDAVTSTKKTWSSNKISGMALPTGTVANNTLRWNGSSWEESTAFTNTGTNIATTGSLTIRPTDTSLSYITLSNAATYSEIRGYDADGAVAVGLECSPASGSNSQVRVFRLTNSGYNAQFNIFAGNNTGQYLANFNSYTSKINFYDCTNNTNIYSFNCADRRLEIANTNNGLYFTPAAPASDATILHLAGVTDTPTIKYSPATTEYQFSKSVSATGALIASTDATIGVGGKIYFSKSGTYGSSVFMDSTWVADRIWGDFADTTQDILKITYPTDSWTTGVLIGNATALNHGVQLTASGQIRTSGRILSGSYVGAGTYLNAGTYVNAGSYVKAGTDFTSVANYYNGGGSLIASNGTGNLSTALGTNQLTWTATDIDCTADLNIKSVNKLQFDPPTDQANSGVAYFDYTRATDRDIIFTDITGCSVKLNFPAAREYGLQVGVVGQDTNYVTLSASGNARTSGMIRSGSYLQSGTYTAVGSYLTVGSYAKVATELHANRNVCFRDDYFNIPYGRDGSKNCIGHWVFTTGTPEDISGRGYDITSVQAPSLRTNDWTSGRFHSAMYVDNTQLPYATYPAYTLDSTKDFTFAAWVKADSAGPYDSTYVAADGTAGGWCIMGYYNNAGRGVQLNRYTSLTTTSNLYRGPVWSSPATGTVSSAATIANLGGNSEYVHLVLTRNYTGTMNTLYVNGFADSSTATRGDIGTQTQIFFADATGNGYQFRSASSYIAEAAAFDYVLSAAEARSLYMKGLQTKPIILTAAGGYPATTTPCGGPTQNEDSTNDVDYWTLDFDTSNSEAAFWTFPLPDDYQPGTTMKAQVNWMADSGTNANVVRWILKARNLTDNTIIDGTWGTDTTIEDAWQANKYLHKSPIRILNSSTYPKAGETMIVKVKRDVTVSNDMTGDAKLLSVKLEYTPMR